MELDPIQSVVESLLFCSDKPVSEQRLLEGFDPEAPPELEQIKACLENLQQKYSNPESGIELRTAQGGYQFVTSAKNSAWVRRFLAMKPFRLSRTALETLAIISYRQPVTRAEIDKVRGIDSSHIVRTLIEKGVVRMMGKADIPGRPVQYGTTPKFLELLGLDDLTKLPTLSELKDLDGDAKPEELSIEETIEQGLDRFVQDQVTSEELLSETDEELDEISRTLKETATPSGEVFKSPLEAEVAAENQLSLECFSDLTKRWKKPAAAPVADMTAPAE